jgi:SAM-dependent methyltransferase
MEHISRCLICDNFKRTVLHENIRGYAVLKCSQCGMVYCNRHPSDDELERYYSEEHGLVDKSLSTDAQNDAEKYKDTKLFLKLIKKYNPQSKTICEIGCSYGYLLWGLQKAGYIVKGYELSKITAKVGREKLDLDITQGNFPQHSDSLFDVFILRHVLEHLKNPEQIIDLAYKQMNPGAIIVIATPNIRSLAATLFRTSWNWMDPPLHLFYFSQKTLEQLLNKHKFDVLEVFTRKGDSLNFYHHLLRWLMQHFNPQRENYEKKAAPPKKNLAFFAKRFLLFGCQLAYILTYPVWWLFWKLGYGEEIWVIAQKTDRR